MRTAWKGNEVRWGAECRGGLDEMDAPRAHQEQALSLAKGAGDMGLQARTWVALAVSHPGGLTPAG
jgi:hypothetical protein